MTTPTPGLPEPPGEGASALPAGTFSGVAVAVTGGGTGLGKAIAVEFARLGAQVAILSRNPDHHAAGIAAVEAAGGKATAVACDIRDAGAVATAFDELDATTGTPTVLVNNAAGNFPVPAEDLSPNGWRAVVGSVLDGTFHCSREFGRRHLAALAADPAGEATAVGPSIINIGASYAWTAGPGFVHSSAAKAGVKNLTETLAVEWAPYGIRVNGLVPGLFPHEDEAAHIAGPDGVPGRGSADEERRAPALRTGRRRELGWAATFLASPYAAYITGHTLVVDGANWQRRAMLREPFTPIREQLGRPPFTLD